MSLTTRGIALLVTVASLAGASEGSAQKRDPYLLLQPEIASHTDIRTAYEAVQQLRPRFFRGTRSFSPERGVTSSTDRPEPGQDPAGGASASDGILVVVNGSRRGGVTELKGIPAEQVESIHFIKSDEARGIYGPDQSGVIEVKTSLRAKDPGA